MQPDLSLVDPLDHHLATRVNVGDMLTRSAALFPDRVAVVDGDTEITYRELASTADRFGRALLDEGVEPGTAVALLMTNSWKMLAAYYGCARAGLVVLPLNIVLLPELLTWIVGDAEATAIVADEALRPKLEPVVAGSPAVRTVVMTSDAPEPVADRRTVSWNDILAAASDEGQHAATQRGDDDGLLAEARGQAQLSAGCATSAPRGRWAG